MNRLVSWWKERRAVNNFLKANKYIGEMDDTYKQMILYSFTDEEIKQSTVERKLVKWYNSLEIEIKEEVIEDIDKSVEAKPKAETSI